MTFVTTTRDAACSGAVVSASRPAPLAVWIRHWWARQPRLMTSTANGWQNYLKSTQMPLLQHMMASKISTDRLKRHEHAAFSALAFRGLSSVQTNYAQRHRR